MTKGKEEATLAYIVLYIRHHPQDTPNSSMYVLGDGRASIIILHIKKKSSLPPPYQKAKHTIFKNVEEKTPKHDEMEETGEVEERGKRAWKMERMKEKEEKSLFILLKRMKLEAGGEKWKIASKMGEREREVEENMCVNKAQGQGEKVRG